MGFSFLPPDLTSLQIAVINAAARLIQTQRVMAQLVANGQLK